MKKYKGITFKLFVILTSFLISFVCIIVYIQIFIVGRLYMTTNYTLDLEKRLYDKLISDNFFAGYTFLNEYSSNSHLSDNIIIEISNYETVNKAYLIILDKNFDLKYITNNTKKILRTSNLNSIKNHLINTSSNLNINGFTLTSECFSSSSENKLTGNIVKQDYPFMLSLGEKETFRVYNNFVPSKYIAMSTPVLLCNNEINHVVVIVPEVFTDKSSTILIKYIVYILAASVISILVLSALFSYLITKPIVKINKVASKMINLDFSAQCNINSNDEIGNLSQSLNYLSSKLNDTLEKLYSANDKLQKDLDLQKELELLRKDFIASVSHEFKTPITLIKGYTESLKDNVAEEEEKEVIYDIITTEVDKMDRLIQDLLELSQMESDRYKLNIAEFYLDELLENILKKYALIFNEKNVIFQTLIENKDFLITGDAFKIEQVITNFLNNALIHTKKDHHIYISLKRDSNFVIFSVENEGNHIPDNEIKNIWEKFYRIDKSRNSKSGGTGLGLAICKAILERHTSTYGAYNTNKGVNFYFKLPINANTSSTID